MSSSIQVYDIVIVGAGPVGLMLAVCLGRWGYRVKIIDKKEVPTVTGRADGIQPRSLHLLRNMGLKRQIMAYEPAKVYEVAFWGPDATGGGICRTGNWSACPPVIDARYPFTTLLHQGLIERVFIDDLRNSDIFVQRPWTITAFKYEGEGLTHPIRVDLKHVQRQEAEVVRAKYLFSAEGARSFIRDQLGVKVHHKDPISNVWGVMDGVVRTDFPDVKMKCTIHSNHGSIMIIPRENNLVRLYIQIATSTDNDFNPRKQATQEEVQSAAKKILQPYYIEWDRVEWYSVYPIGQGIAEKYTIDHRIFMGGDCCHTHSPKAGQGMNTAFHDALNLSWKLHHVETGFANRSILQTYESERKAVAEDLLNFDAKYAALFSKRMPSSREVTAAASHTKDDSSPANEFVQVFKSSQEFTSGYGIAYGPNPFNWHPSHPAQHPLLNPSGTTLRPGRVMPSANVTRVADANIVHLEQAIPLNGSFRIFIFAGHPPPLSPPPPSPSRPSPPSPPAQHQPQPQQQQLQQQEEAEGDEDHYYHNPLLSTFATALSRPQSFYRAHARPDIATISPHERHNPHSRFFTLCTIIAAHHSDIEIARLPPLLARYSDHVYADDVVVVAADGKGVPKAKADVKAKEAGEAGEEGRGKESGEKEGRRKRGAAHAKMGLDAGVVVVRPDGHVGCVVGLVEGSGTVDALDEYFGAFVTKGVGYTSGKKKKKRDGGGGGGGGGGPLARL